MTTETVRISELMTRSGVGFGTSGARGLVSAMTDRVCYLYTLAFLQHLYPEGSQRSGTSPSVAVAGDLRPSTPRIMQAVSRAIGDFGAEVIACGTIPSPAVACYGIQAQIPSIMVTGSHIPDDRNGIKFNKPEGEILKSDEAGIRAQSVIVPEGLFDDQGQLVEPSQAAVINPAAYDHYLARFTPLISDKPLAGKRLGVYQHSGVARDLLVELLQGAGAEVLSLGRSERFIPVDTEAIRAEDIELAQQWRDEFGLDAILSTDGDADRPLISDEQGHWLRGDIAGVLCARYLGAEHLVTPVSSNTVAEKSGWFDSVVRSRIGSPFVIEAMEQLLAGGKQRVVGYEANGGFLQASDLSLGDHELASLPTRDAVIVILSILLLSVRQGQPISRLVATLPPRYTHSDRIRNYATENSRRMIDTLSGVTDTGGYAQIDSLLGDLCGGVTGVDETDGLRMTFESGEIVHFRPSGNAPELRCYTEADEELRARELNRDALQRVQAAFPDQ